MTVRSNFRESVLRDYLYEHPEILFASEIARRQKEVCIDGKFIDLLFEVEGVHHIVELKRDSITREAVGQVLEYYGRLRQAYPERKYQVVLVAPSIPRYRSIPLEEFGIRCVELSFPEEAANSSPPLETSLLEITQVRSALNRPSPLSDTENISLDRVLLKDLQPPCAQHSVPIAHKLMVDAIPRVQSIFDNHEVMPVAMVRANQPDVLCVPEISEAGSLTFVRGGAWWAFAFGKSEQLAKNDTPNISVIGNPWGLDFSINAELRTSQRSLLGRVRSHSKEFDRLVAAHGQLALQTWLKFEHQPRFYHWVPLGFLPFGQWNAAKLLSSYSDLNSRYGAIREEWLKKIIANQLNLSLSQAAHLKQRNGQMNLAIRLVKTFGIANDIWTQSYDEQRASFDQEYVALKPLVQFFN